MAPFTMDYFSSRKETDRFKREVKMPKAIVFDLGGTLMEYTGYRTLYSNLQ